MGGDMKPSEAVLLGSGWSEGDIRYELSELTGGFFELKWFDPIRINAQGDAVFASESMFSSWFKERSEARAVFNAVVVCADWPAERFLGVDIASVEGNLVAGDGTREMGSGEARKPWMDDIDEILCQTEPRRRIEHIVDEVHALIAAEDQAHEERRDAMKRVAPLVEELTSLLEQITKSNPAQFKASADSRSFRRPSSAEDREERTYQVYRWRYPNPGAEWRLTIAYRMPDNTYRGKVEGFHLLEILEHLLGYGKKSESFLIALGTNPGDCLCGCRSYRVQGSASHVSKWLDPKHNEFYRSKPVNQMPW